MLRLPPLLLAAAAVVVVAVSSRATGPLPLTTYVGNQEVLWWLMVSASLALLVLGLLVRRPARRRALFLLALMWWVPELAGWTPGPLVVRTFAAAITPILPALVVVAVVPSDDGDRLVRGPIRVAVLGGLLAGAARLTLVDPFLDVGCWRTCEHNPLLIADGRLLGVGLHGAGVALGAVGAAWAGCLRVRDSALGVERRRLPTALAGLCMAAVLLGTAGPAVLRFVVDERPHSWPFLLPFVFAQVGVLGWALTEARRSLVQWRSGVRLRRLAGEVQSSPAPGSLAKVLRQALCDPDLAILYWAPGRQGYVDPAGRPAPTPRAGAGRSVTFVGRQGQPVAALVHAADVDGASLDRTLGAALRLVLANEQLQAATLAELAELQSSSLRIVERAELERRRLERNLHDGAQQRVVCLALMVRRLQTHATSQRATALTARAAVLTQVTVDELRRVARGIYPAVLADGGLAGALLEIAESSIDLSVEVGRVPRQRYPRTVETTAYLVAVAAAADARAGQASWLQVSGTERDGRLQLDLEHDALRDASAAVRGLDDQVRALSGELDVERHGDGTTVRLRLPCGS